MVWDIVDEEVLVQHFMNDLPGITSSDYISIVNPCLLLTLGRHNRFGGTKVMHRQFDAGVELRKWFDQFLDTAR